MRLDHVGQLAPERGSAIVLVTVVMRGSVIVVLAAVAVAMIIIMVLRDGRGRIVVVFVPAIRVSTAHVVILSQASHGWPALTHIGAASVRTPLGWVMSPAGGSTAKGSAR
jgi:hypothetical protein